MKFIVASNNPVKINAVRTAITDHFPDASIIGLEVASGVNAQPMSDEETRLGAHNRAQAVRQKALAEKIITPDESVLCVGLEGGAFHPSFVSDSTALWSTVWVAAIDEQATVYESSGARFPIPEFIARLLRDGQELGPALGALVGDADLRSKSGMIGYLTQQFTDRTREYASIAQMTIGLWYGAKRLSTPKSS